MKSRKMGLLIAIAASVSLAGCAAMEDFATNPDKAKTRSGAGYGAAAGAVVGLLTAGNNPFKSAMIGAAAGALVGGAAGNYMDKQEAKLRQQMAGTGVDVVRKGDNITLDMPGNVTFAFDSSDVNPQLIRLKNASTSGISKKPKAVNKGIRERTALRVSIQSMSTSVCICTCSVHSDEPEEIVLEIFFLDHQPLSAAFPPVPAGWLLRPCARRPPHL